MVRNCKRWLFVTLFLLIWLGLGLRLVNASAFSFWTDEGLTPLRASYPVLKILSNQIIIQDVVTKDTHPPFFYLLIHFSRQVWGETDFAFRYLSLLAGVLLVPLMYQFGRRLHNGRLGMVAALVTAVNPLQIYYANEARMYTLLVLLAAAASYVLWRALQLQEMGSENVGMAPPVHGPSSHGKGTTTRLSLYHYLGLYVLLAGLALYTHYVTIFFIAGQGLFWVWVLWRRGYKRLLLGTAVTGALLALPLIPFTVPRLFTGAEANYYLVSPLIMLQDVVRFFHLGRSVDFEHTAVKVINLAAFGLLLSGLYAAKGSPKRAFLLVYLLAAVLGLMLGSLLIKPMYQGVRHIMVGSPAFLLLLSWGLVAAGERWLLFRNQYSVISQRYAGRSRRAAYQPLWGAMTIVAVMVIVGGSLVALHKYYFDKRFAKDDFRGMIAFIEERAGPNDVIIYNNAILLPLHEHYQTRPDVALTAVPLYPHLAQDVAVQQLTALAAAYDRLWFVTDPPADGRDDDDLSRTWLQAHLAQVGSYLFPAQTTEVRVIAYETTPHAAATLPASAQPLLVEWSAWPRLAGISLNVPQPVAVPTLWFSLYWQGQAPAAGTAVRFTLQDANGFTWWAATDEWLQPKDSAWPDSALVRQSYQLPLTPGILPGPYTLLAQPVSGMAGDPLAEAYPLATVEIAAGSDWPVPPQVRQRAALAFDNGLALAKVDILDDEVRPGHTLPLNLYWHTGPEAQPNLIYELEVLAPDGTQLRTQSDPLGASWLASLPPHTLLREHTGLYFPPEVTPGQYRLRWQLRDGDTVIGGRPFWRPWSQARTLYGAVTVLPWPLETELPADITPIKASLGNDIQLYGYELDVGETAVDLALTWQTIHQPPENYLLFVHLVSDDGHIVSQIDPVPGGGLRPTRSWRPGEVLTDQHTLPLPPDLPPGTYQVWLGMWQPDSGQRLPVNVEGVTQPDGRLLLQTLRSGGE